jgi:hypothetical protein
MLSAMRLPAPSLRQAGLPLSAASALSAVNMLGAFLSLVWRSESGFESSNRREVKRRTAYWCSANGRLHAEAFSGHFS